MGEITIRAHDMHHLLTDSTHPGTSYQQAFAYLARTHRGRPAAEILPLLRAAADAALLNFTGADLAEAISNGVRY